MNENPWTTLRFTVNLPPRGQARSRSHVLTDRNGMPVRSQDTGRFVVLHHKTPEQKQDEEKLSSLLLQFKPARPIRGPVKLGLRAYVPIPQSKPKKFQTAAAAGEIQPEVKPDLDNVLKHVKDVMTGIFWEDDKQVVGYLNDTGKYYGEPARYELTIMFRKDRQEC